MGWTEPIQGWSIGMGIQDNDLTKTENNLLHVEKKLDNTNFYLLERDIWGYEINTSGSRVYISSGCAMSTTNYEGWRNAIYNDSTQWYKVLTTWASGSGNGCLCNGFSLQDYTWYYLFVIKNTSTDAIDFALDNNTSGSNIVYSVGGQFQGYNVKRRIGCIKVYYESESGTWYSTTLKSYGSRFFMGGDIAMRSFTSTLTSTIGALWGTNLTTYNRVLPSIKVRARGFVTGTTALTTIFFWPTLFSTFPSPTALCQDNYTPFELIIDTNGQFYAATDYATTNVTMVFTEFYDERA